MTTDPSGFRELHVEQACEVTHDAYEAAAASIGWVTPERNKVPWSEVPEANKIAMRHAIGTLIDWLEVHRIMATATGPSGSESPG